MAHFSLLWEDHQNNIANGFGVFQQNAEFVDMTLAADGHVVKVHQIIMAMASPYLKELINTAHCPHPVIFLNNISFKTLRHVLEYIYTGQAVVAMENLKELIEVGRNLHIKGIKDMKYDDLQNNGEIAAEKAMQSSIIQSHDSSIKTYNETMTEYSETDTSYHQSSYNNTSEVRDDAVEMDSDSDTITRIDSRKDPLESKTNFKNKACSLQYTVTNQGSLQIILNRYLYYLKYSNKKKVRQWRCVDYITNVRCPAFVTTKDDMVVQRKAAHIHPYHDKKILKKFKRGCIFSQVNEAQKKGQDIKSIKGDDIEAENKEQDINSIKDDDISEDKYDDKI